MYYKRYLVFRMSQYYPSGGFSDFTGDYDTLDEAIESLPKRIPSDEWAEIVDLKTGSRRHIPDES